MQLSRACHFQAVSTHNLRVPVTQGEVLLFISIIEYSLFLSKVDLRLCNIKIKLN